MKKTSLQSRLVEWTDNVICNMCGEDCTDDYLRDEHLGAYIMYGYDSKYIGDLVTLNFDMCEKCTLDLIVKFKISPIEKIDDVDPTQEYDEDQHIKDYFKMLVDKASEKK